MTKIENDFRKALAETGLVQPIESKSRASSVEVLCRLMPGSETKWPAVAERLLRAGLQAGIDVHVCRRFILKDDKMVFGIHVGVTGSTAKTLPTELAVVMAELITPSQVGEDAEALLKPGRRLTKEQIRSMTKAHPQPPAEPASVKPPPPGFKPAIKVVNSGVDANGRKVSVEEFPLPHQYGHDRNMINSKGRGAVGSSGAR
jgi:hypothetical protein